MKTYLYMGAIDTMNWTSNYVDLSGGNTAFGNDTKDLQLGTTNVNGNYNLVSGNACTLTSCP